MFPVGNYADLLQQVRMNDESYVSDLIAMQNGWSSKARPVCHFSWEDNSPPMSHLGTPTEDFCPPHNSPVQSFSQHNSCLSLQMPMNSTTTTAVTPPAQLAAPANAIMMSTTSPQQSLAIKQFKFSTVSDTPTPSPSSNDDDYSAISPTLSDKQECSEDFAICKSKQEILKLIPKDVRVPQSKQ